MGPPLATGFPFVEWHQQEARCLCGQLFLLGENLLEVSLPRENWEGSVYIADVDASGGEVSLARDSGRLTVSK